MRINPISMTYNRQNFKPQNQNIKQNQNISFGNYENEKAEKLTYDTLGVKKDDTGIPTRVFEYYKNTKLATVKTAQDKQGRDFPYVVLNKEITDKHENKDKFDKLLKDYTFYKDTQYGKMAEEAGLYEKEPYILAPFNDFVFGRTIYDDISKAEAEEEEDYTPAETSAAEDEGTGYDYWKSMDSWPFGL